MSTQQIPREQFLTIAINLLNKAFLEASRTDAKSIYRDLEDGKVVALTRVQMEDESLVQFDLSLNRDEYRGRLNFGSFRAGLALLIANIVDALKSDEPMRTFHAEHDTDIVIFGVTAVTVEDEEPSVLVLGADASGGQPSVQLQLMYLDHSQFPRNDEQVAGEVDGAVGDGSGEVTTS